MSRLTASFFLLCAVLAVKLHFLHDEGIFSFDLAAALPRAFLPLLFFVKVKPPIVLLYALPAQVGLKAFLVAHAAVAAAAILLTAGAARRLGLANPALAGFALATSLGFVVASASGFANSDGAFFLALFLWLWAGKHRLAGLVLGMLPFVRYELAFPTLVFLVWDRRLWKTALVFPAVYLAGGALYHRDPLWLAHTFSNLTQPEDIRRYHTPSVRDLVKFVATSLAVNFSLLGIVGLTGWDRRWWPLFVAAAGTFGLLIAFAFFDWFGVDRSLRYHVAPLPLVALLAASWRRPAGFLVAVQAAGLAAALLASDYGRDRHLQSHQLMEAVKKSRLWHGQTLYTDLHIARYDTCAGPTGSIDAWMLANDSIAYELEHYLDDGQRQAVLAALEGQRFVVERRLHHGALYLIDPERDRRWREILDATPATEPLGRYRLYQP